MKKFVALITLLVLCATPAFASFTTPSHNGQYVVDEAGILTDALKKELTRQLSEWEKQTTNQMVILVLPTLNGEDIANVANQVARDWKIGQKDKNNGVLILRAVKEKKTRIEVGRGLEPYLTDAITKMVLEEDMKPLFKVNKSGEAFLEAIKKLRLATTEEGSKAVKEQIKHSSQDLPDWPWWGWGILIIAIMLIGCILGDGPFFLFWLALNLFGGGSSGGGNFGGGDFGGGGSSSDD